jgi:hypothetical protein
VFIAVSKLRELRTELKNWKLFKKTLLEISAIWECDGRIRRPGIKKRRGRRAVEGFIYCS